MQRIPRDFIYSLGIIYYFLNICELTFSYVMGLIVYSITMGKPTYISYYQYMWKKYGIYLVGIVWMIIIIA